MNQSRKNPGLVHVFSYKNVNELMNCDPCFFSPCSDVPFTIDRNVLAFDIKHWLNLPTDRTKIDTILIDFDPSNQKLLEVSINDRFAPFIQNEQIVSFVDSPIVNHGSIVKFIFAETPSVARVCYTLMHYIRSNESRSNNTDTPLSSVRNKRFVASDENNRIRFGPYTESTFDKKYIPKSFCLRKIVIDGEPIKCSIVSDDRYLMQFFPVDMIKGAYKLKCDHPLFHCGSGTRIKCKSSFYLDGVINHDSNPDSILDKDFAVFATETTKVTESPKYHYRSIKDGSIAFIKYDIDMHDLCGELFVKCIKVATKSGSHFCQGFSITFDSYNHALVDDFAANYSSTDKGWIPKVTQSSINKGMNHLIIPFDAHPKSIITESYLFANRFNVLSFSAVIEFKEAKELFDEQLMMKFYCFQVLALRDGQLYKVFDS